MKISYFIFLLILLVISGWFYWFQYRPSALRISCVQKVRARAGKADSVSWKLLNNLYRICMSENGLKPEDLIK